MQSCLKNLHSHPTRKTCPSITQETGRQTTAGRQSRRAGSETKAQGWQTLDAPAASRRCGPGQIWLAVVGRGNREIEIPKFYEWCRDNIPADIPDRVFELSEIPRNRLGKVSRETLKQQLKALDQARSGT